MEVNSMSKRKAQKRCFLFFKHKIEWKKGFGFKCKRCGKTPQQIRLEGGK
jgi:uncharacterized OB-fold protein